MYLETEQDLKEVLGLRRERDEDGSTIAKSRLRRLRRDHLYFHGPGKLGVYYETPTRRRTTRRRAWWVEQFPAGSLLEERRGDLDGLLVFRVEDDRDIPRVFVRKKATPAVAAAAAKGRAARLAKTSPQRLAPAPESLGGVPAGL